MDHDALLPCSIWNGVVTMRSVIDKVYKVTN